MFIKTTEPLGEFELVRVTNQETGEYFSTIPSCGGKIYEIVLRKGEQLISILDKEIDEGLINSDLWHKGEFLAPFPNRVKDSTYSFNGETYTLPINMPSEGHAIHGFVYDKTFTVSSSDLEETGILEMSYDYDGMVEGYPFPFTLNYIFKLSADGFACEVSCSNKGEMIMPFGFGWHPYFALGDVNDLELRLPHVSSLSVDDRMIPTGEKEKEGNYLDFTPIGDTFFDTGFLIEGDYTIAATSIRSREHDVTISIWQKMGVAGFGYVQVFTPPGRKTVAIEPMTCPANAFNSHESLIILEPGDSWGGVFGVSLS